MFGEQSAKPEGGYDKKSMAQDVHALAASLGLKRVGICGHDIGLMVAMPRNIPMKSSASP